MFKIKFCIYTAKTAAFFVTSASKLKKTVIFLVFVFFFIYFYDFFSTCKLYQGNIMKFKEKGHSTV